MPIISQILDRAASMPKYELFQWLLYSIGLLAVLCIIFIAEKIWRD